MLFKNNASSTIVFHAFVVASLFCELFVLIKVKCVSRFDSPILLFNYFCMRNFQLFLMLSVIFLFTNSLFSQNNDWVKLMQKGASFKEIQDAFYKEWKGKPYEKGKGYKQFKRWEYYWQSRLLADGSFPLPDYLAEILQAEEKKNSYRNTGDANWKLVGPLGTSSANKGVGRVNIVAVDPNNINILYLGTPVGGIWKSVNGGDSWTALSDQLPSIGVSGIAIDPNNSNIIYIGTGDFDHSDSQSDGVYKSINGGSTWLKSGNIFGVKVGKVAIDPSNSNIVFAATNMGLYRSVDGGSSWTAYLSSEIIFDFEFKPGNSQIIYVGTANNFYTSINNGVNFTATSTGLPSSSTSKFLVAVTPADVNYVYVLVSDNNDNFKGVFLSNNGGSLFSAQNTSTDIFENSQSWYDLAFVASPVNKNMIFTGCLNIWKSTSAGTSFTKVSAYTHVDIHNLHYLNGNLWAATDGGIFKSADDGVSFTSKSVNLAISQIYNIAGLESNRNILSAGLQDNGGNSYNGVSWKEYHDGDGVEAALDETNHLMRWGMAQDGQLFFTTDNAVSSATQTVPLPSNSFGDWVTALEKDPNANRVLVGYEDLWEYTIANGWGKLTSLALFTPISDIEIFKGNSNIIYFSHGNTLYKTTNGGGNAALLTTPWLNNITSIEVDQLNADNIWVTVAPMTPGEIVFSSSNGGQTWVNYSTGLPTVYTNVIKFDATSATKALYVGNDLGVYVRDNTMLTWTVFDDNLPNTPVTDLEINQTLNLIRASTFGRGIWESHTYNDQSVVVSHDVVLVDADVTNDLVCGTFIPKITIANKGNSTLTDLDFAFKIDNNSLLNYHWSGSLAQDQLAQVTLNGLSTPTSGNHQLHVAISNPNGFIDGSKGDDTASYSFSFAPGGHLVSYKISQSSKNPLHMWTLYQGATFWGISLVYPPVVENGFEVQKFCLDENKCYTLNVSDAFINNANVNDFYELTDVSQNTSLLLVTAAQYTNPTSSQFCIQSTTGTEVLEQLTLNIYPNPNGGVVRIKTLPMNCEIKIFNILGDEIYCEKEVYVYDGYEVNMTQFAEGLYTMVVTTKNQKQVFKIVRK